MPRVGKKEFAYDEPGMAAAEAEAARTGQDVAGNDEAALDELLADMPVEEAPIEEVPPEEGEIPDAEIMEMAEGMMIELFQAIFGDAFDPEDPADAARMEQLDALLEANPELAEALASGEISPAELAIQFYRAMGMEEAPEGPPLAD